MRTGGLRARVGAALASVLALTGTTVAAVGGFTPQPAGAQMADHATALPGLMDTMVVDAATSHVFVSLYDTGEVDVLDLDGTLVRRLTGEPGARGLALQGNKLYVVASTTGTVDVFNTTTLERTRTLVTGLTGIDYVAVTASAVWVVQRTRCCCSRPATDRSARPCSMSRASRRS
jgi:hypothetical protein